MPAIIKTQWYCCAKCKTVDEVHTYADGTTDMPRGEFLAHGVYEDWLTVGFDDAESARRYLDASDRRE